MKRIILVAVMSSAVSLTFAQKKPSAPMKHTTEVAPQPKKEVVYQVFTRLFGNKNTTNKPWGTIEENGVGKFNDFTDKALQEIKKLGVTYIWYTGVPHHDVIRDYTAYGISNDDPDVVKGRAGSPYAVKDYYNVNPDLAVDPAKRLQEFEALIARTHKNGLKVIIDIVPNHIARNYKGLSNPAGVRDFGADDNTTVEYARNNNFYYLPGQAFEVPVSDSYKPLGGEINPLIDGKFSEYPAKWTGNNVRKANPDINDWYETVKVNYGIKPDGSKDFPELPDGFAQKDYQKHYAFWQGKDVPDSWKKFRDIALYWVAKGVDGFRYDMAEMVPVEFWSYMNSSIKMKNPKAFLMAEVYNPKEYRNYIQLGKMDYLYDKVDTYDHLKAIIQGKATTDKLVDIEHGMHDIEHHMIHFLDNHDEQRLASAAFAGAPERGMPMMVYSATVGSSPTMVYFGQEVGEDGQQDGGFGKPTRTSIFDYVGVPHHQRWMNGGKFDGGQLTEAEKKLRDFYSRLLNFTQHSSALTGNFQGIHRANKTTEGYTDALYSYVRWSAHEKLITVLNFDGQHTAKCNLNVPATVIAQWHLQDGTYTVTDQLYGSKAVLTVAHGEGSIPLTLSPNESFIFKLP
ncbi:alpha-amylase family protein [Flavobacterium sp. XGLA_31]|uniref:alpha-amylase family protein n=1 Tax=Flavobacterium sp. XGLA_31 TaxID=3447666 RepID=UPI003F3A5106